MGSLKTNVYNLGFLFVDINYTKIILNYLGPFVVINRILNDSFPVIQMVISDPCSYLILKFVWTIKPFFFTNLILTAEDGLISYLERFLFNCIKRLLTIVYGCRKATSSINLNDPIFLRRAFIRKIDKYFSYFIFSKFLTPNF